MANFDLKDRSAVVGVGNSQYGRRLMRSPIDLAADAIANALDDAGLTREDLDGMIVSFGSPIGADGDTLAQVLGLKLRVVQSDLGARPLHRELHPMGRDDRQCGHGGRGRVPGVGELLRYAASDDGRRRAIAKVRARPAAATAKIRFTA